MPEPEWYAWLVREAPKLDLVCITGGLLNLGARMFRPRRDRTVTEIMVRFTVRKVEELTALK